VRVAPSSGCFWGWHRLDDIAARRLVAEAGISAGDLVLDIGAGTGALTAPLVHAGARVVAVELHAGRARALRQRFDRDPVTVVQTDAMDLRLPTRPFRVVANPPFASITSIMRRLLGSRTLVRADLVVPRHVAARWSGRYEHSDIRTTHWISRSMFHPAASDDAFVLVITRFGAQARRPRGSPSTGRSRASRSSRARRG
jgi:23S rRNA (adenine-N6)-dimethyltransferase